MIFTRFIISVRFLDDSGQEIWITGRYQMEKVAVEKLTNIRGKPYIQNRVVRAFSVYM